MFAAGPVMAHVKRLESKVEELRRGIKDYFDKKDNPIRTLSYQELKELDKP